MVLVAAVCFLILNIVGNDCLEQESIVYIKRKIIVIIIPLIYPTIPFKYLGAIFNKKKLNTYHISFPRQQATRYIPL